MKENAPQPVDEKREKAKTEETDPEFEQALEKAEARAQTDSPDGRQQTVRKEDHAPKSLEHVAPAMMWPADRKPIVSVKRALHSEDHFIQAARG